ncbi:MAG TPA: hypothetical protein VNW28_02800, partial [Chthoniobacterales bacterium]|nr:hypothetical protein [Chthoniobacterales bacterium]
LVTAALAVALAMPGAAAVKKIAYPEVKVTLNEPYKPDPAFEKMHSQFLDAIKCKDLQALTALVAPTFLWTVGDTPADELDLGRDAIHNFKVAFGFRGLGKDADGGVDNGPYWDVLASFADDATYYAATDSGNLVCGPIAAEVADDRIFEQARKRIETANEAAEWYFTLAETAVAKAPSDTGAPVAKVGIVALPLLGFYPPEKQGAPPPAPTHFEVLLPSGRTLWLPVTAVRPLSADHLCYARTPSGDWKIAAIDQASQ